MPSFTERKPYTCCNNASYDDTGRHDDGEVAYIHSECRSCGAVWRDVFTYAYSEHQDGTGGRE